MNVKNSQIILVNDMKLDKEYKNVINLSEQQILNLCQQKQVAIANNYSFLKVDDNVINTSFSYATCLKADYMAFQNPNYSNKWFFAFIDRIEYISDACTRIYYTIDEFSTWFNYLTVQPCFVIREHVNSDVVGEHTVPENVELGEYVTNGVYKDETLNDLVYIIQVTEWTTTGNNPLATNYGGVFNVGGAYICETITQVANIVNAYQNGREDAILNVYIVPNAIVNNTSGSLQYSGQNEPSRYDININKPTSLNGYTPKNKKLLTYPYQYLILDNNSGISNILQFENFAGDSCGFTVMGVPTVGGSIKCVPKLYKGNLSFQEEGIMAGKYPTCGWVNDTYTNWLTQNGVNIGIGVISSGLQILGGAGLLMSGVGATAGIGAMTSGTLGIASSIGQVYQHSIMPDSASGNINGGDINTCEKTNSFYFINMSIKQEYARIIDDYLTRQGYKVNRLKKPNITGRANYNYVQIADSENIGYASNTNISIPATSMDTINKIFRSGTTIWHNYANLGNYAVDNSIVN